MYIVERGWNDPTVGAQNVARFLHGFIERAGRLFERRKEQVAETVASQFAALKSVVHERAHEYVLPRERYETSRHIPRREDAELVPQDSRGPAAVRHRHNRGEIYGVFLES